MGEGPRVSATKRVAEGYPDALQQALLHQFSFETEFSLWLAQAGVEQDDRYYVTAHIVRSVSALNQVLFALNREYCLNEKKAVKLIEGFALRPVDYRERVDAVFAAAGTDSQSACAQLRQLVAEGKALLSAEQTEHAAAVIDSLSNREGAVK